MLAAVTSERLACALCALRRARHETYGIEHFDAAFCMKHMYNNNIAIL